MSNTTLFSDESAVLRRLVALLLGPRAASWESVDSAMLPLARATYFLLDAERGGDVESFVTLTLERLLRQLNRASEQHRIALQGSVRGPIVWQQTFKARHTQGYDPTRYVCREVRRQYDTPENQLLKFMVERIGESLRLVPEVLRAGACYMPTSAGLERDAVATHERLGRIEATLHQLRQHTRLRDVTLPQQIGEQHLLRAETSRTEDYALVARLYRQYRAIVISSRKDSLVAAGRRALILPGRAGADGEPWIQLGAAILRA
jgi:hypothetical protein